MEGVAAIYDMIKTSNPLEKAQLNLAKLDAQSAVTQKTIELLDHQMATALPGQKERDKKVAELSEQRQVLLDAQKLAAEKFNVSVSQKPLTSAKEGFQELAGVIPFLVWPGQKMASQQRADDSKKQWAAYKPLLEQNAADIELARAGTLPGMAGQDDYLAKLEEQRKLEAEQKSRRQQRTGIQSNLTLAQQQALFGFGQEQSDRNMTRNAYGRDPTDTLNRQRAGLDEDITALKKNPNADIAERGQLLEDIYAKTKNLQDLINREPEIQKEINQLIMDRNKEFMKSVMGDGPAELLKKLSAFRLAFDDKGKRRNDISQGQFFSMDAGGRSNYGMLNPTFDPQMIELKNELKRNLTAIFKEFGSFDPKIINEKMLSFADDLTAAAKGLKDLFPTAAVEAAAELIEKAGTRVGAALDALSDRLEKFNPVPVAAGSVNGTQIFRGTTPGMNRLTSGRTPGTGQ